LLLVALLVALLLVALLLVALLLVALLLVALLVVLLLVALLLVVLLLVALLLRCTHLIMTECNAHPFVGLRFVHRHFRCAKGDRINIQAVGAQRADTVIRRLQRFRGR
jgi:hypothetical protein